MRRNDDLTTFLVGFFGAAALVSGAYVLLGGLVDITSLQRIMVVAMAVSLLIAVWAILCLPAPRTLASEAVDT